MMITFAVRFWFAPIYVLAKSRAVTLQYANISESLLCIAYFIPFYNCICNGITLELYP